MANNVSITAGSGTTIASDQLADNSHVQLVKLVNGTEDATDRIPGEATNGLDVDVTRVIPGTSATHLGKAEDAGHTTGDTGVMALAVRNDANAAISGTTLDYTPLSVDSSGRLKVLSHGRLVTTRLWYHSGALVVGASADGANVGRFYLINEADSTVLVAVTLGVFRSQIGSALATPTSPRFVLRTFTATGNASGASLTGVEQDTSYGAKNANWSVRTASTGLSITEVADICSFFPTAGATAVAYAPACEAWFRPEPDRPLILRAGEGLMLKQADNGTTSDTRRVTFDFEVEEITQV